VARPAHEYRIQVTGVSALEAEPGYQTLLLGWWDEAQLFAAFDFQRHEGPVAASPSIQIQEESLRAAHEHGLATQLKENQEVAVSFRPDLFMHYVEHARQLHGFGQSEPDLGILSAVTADPTAVTEQDIAAVHAVRRSTVLAVRRILRDRSFRERVLTAYRQTCAFCPLQMALVEAAHIVPVAEPDSSDDTWNGIAVCPTHHAAYDQAIITVDDRYRVIISETRLRALATRKLHGGLSEFRAMLRPYILLPAEETARPRVSCLQRGREIRRWIE